MKAASDAKVLTGGSVRLLGAEGGPLSKLARVSVNGDTKPEYLAFNKERDDDLVDQALRAALEDDIA